MMNKTKKKNVYVKYAVIMCISGALGGILVVSWKWDKCMEF